MLNCHRWGNFKKYELKVPQNLEIQNTRVKGSDCRYLYGWWFWNSIAEATRDALEKAPGYEGLSDVTVGTESYFFIHCIVVEGNPAREIKK
jgi:hypothetical protein